MDSAFEMLREIAEQLTISLGEGYSVGHSVHAREAKGIDRR